MRRTRRALHTADGAEAETDTQGEESGVNQRYGDGGAQFDAAALGPGALGRRATLVHFSSAFCQPCRATRRVLREVSAMVPGVRHAEVDAEQHLALVRESGIVRTPAVLVLDADGREVSRAYGQPRTADVIAALGAAVAAEEGDRARSVDGEQEKPGEEGGPGAP